MASSTRIASAFAMAAAALVLAGCGGDDEAEPGTTATETTEPQPVAEGPLQASVGPGFEISLVSADGTDVTSLPAGEYTIDVDDKASSHNFHLTGPGVDEDSGVSEMGSSTWTVTLEPGTYEFVCDPHASSMNGQFEVVG